MAGIPRLIRLLNHCAHVGVELDWMPGELFDAAGLYLLSCARGARVSLPVEERDGRVLLKESLIHV